MTPTHTPDLTLFTLAEAAQKRAILARRRKQRRLAANRRASNKTRSTRNMVRSNSQRIGDLYEQRAWEVLQQAGCALLGHQLRCPLGELDLVVRDGQVLVFVEVRYRRSRLFGGATASISRAKQQKLLKTIDWWLPKLVREAFGGKMPQCRIDLATFDQDNLTWHRDAMRLSQDK
jgi:putative endonuclease